MSRDRGQLVLVAAALVALAFVPALAAYLQLGYAGDAHAMAARDDAGTATAAALDPAVDAATPRLAESDAWTDRDAAVSAYRDALNGSIEAIENASVARGRVSVVSYDERAAITSARDACPSGRGRVFGPCEAVGGIVVQERANRTHVVAVAFDVTVIGEGRETHLAVVVRRDG